MRIIDTGGAVVAASPAKLNLRLAILGRRPDRFHEIETVMVKISWYDRLIAAARPDGRLTLSIRRAGAGVSPSIPTGEENLVTRAARLLQQAAGVRFGANLILEKRIPAEAGLAGGSGNAAAALLALNRLWKTGLAQKDLATLAARLGSDVPFFLDSAAAAIARGRGEQLEAIPLRGPFHFVIARPPFGLSTAAVYQAFSEEPPRHATGSAGMVDALAAGDPAAVGRALENDLTPAATKLAPSLAAIGRHMRRACPLGGEMTGSGSALFGLCNTKRQAFRTARQVRSALNIGAVAMATT